MSDDNRAADALSKTDTGHAARDAFDKIDASRGVQEALDKVRDRVQEVIDKLDADSGVNAFSKGVKEALDKRAEQATAPLHVGFDAPAPSALSPFDWDRLETLVRQIVAEELDRRVGPPGAQ